MDEAGEYIKEDDPVLLDSSLTYPQHTTDPQDEDNTTMSDLVNTTAISEAIPNPLADKICAATTKDAKKQILRDSTSSADAAYVAVLDDYLQRPPRQPRSPPPVFVPEGSVPSSALMFSGWGYARLVTGVIYEGEWHHGLMHGRGVVAWPDGTVYQGEVHCGQVQGRGRLLRPDGSYYIGEWREGYRHGLGVWVHPAAGLTYRGMWARGRRHGLGTMFYCADRSVVYHGDWVCGAREGHGVMRYGSQCVYDGAWAEDERQGRGAAVFANGDCYVGEWAHNLMQGTGEYVWGDLPEERGQQRSGESLTLEEYMRGQQAAPRVQPHSEADIAALTARRIAQRPLPSLKDVAQYVAVLSQVQGTGSNASVQRVLRDANLDSTTVLAVAHAEADPHACDGIVDEAAELAAVRGETAVPRGIADAMADSARALDNSLRGDELFADGTSAEHVLLSLDKYFHDDEAVPDATKELVPQPPEESFLRPPAPLPNPDAPLEDAVAQSGPLPLLPLPATLANAASAEVSAPHAYADALLATADPLLRRNRYFGGLRGGVRDGWGAQLYSSGAAYCGEWVNGSKHGNGVFVFDNGLRLKGTFEQDQLKGQEWARVDTALWQLPLSDLLADSVRTLWPCPPMPTEPLSIDPSSPTTAPSDAQTASASRKASMSPPGANTARLRAARMHQKDYEASVASQMSSQQQRLARVLARHGSALYASLGTYAGVEEGGSIVHEHVGAQGNANDDMQDGMKSMTTTLPSISELPVEKPIADGAPITRTQLLGPAGSPSQSPVATLKNVRVRISALRRLCRDAGLLRGSVTELRVSELAAARYSEWVCQGNTAAEHEDHIIFRKHVEDMDSGRVVLLPRHAMETIVRVCVEHARESNETLDELQVQALCQEDSAVALTAAAMLQGVPSMLLQPTAINNMRDASKADMGAALAASPLRTPLSLLPVWAQVKHLLETVALPRLGARQHLDWLAANACALTRDLTLSERDAGAMLTNAAAAEDAAQSAAVRSETLTPRGNTAEYEAAEVSANISRSALQEACTPCGVWPAEDTRTQIELAEPRAAPLAGNDVLSSSFGKEPTSVSALRNWHAALRALRALATVSSDRGYLHQLSLRTCEPYAVEGACRGSDDAQCPCVACARAAFYAQAPPLLPWFPKPSRPLTPLVTRLSVRDILELLTRHGVVDRGLYTAHTRALQWFADMATRDPAATSAGSGAAGTGLATNQVDASLFIPHTHAQLAAEAEEPLPEIARDCRNFFLRGDTGELQRVRTAGKDKGRTHRPEEPSTAAPSEAALASRSRLQYEVEVGEAAGQRSLQEQLFSDHALTPLHVALLALAHTGGWSAAAQDATRVLCFLAYACASTVFMRECVLATKLQQWRAHILAYERRAHEPPPQQERKHNKKAPAAAAAAVESNVDTTPYMARFAAWQASNAGSASATQTAPLISEISMTLQAHRVGLRAARAVLEAVAVRACRGDNVDGERIIAAVQTFQAKARDVRLQPCCVAQAAEAEATGQTESVCTNCASHILTHARAHTAAVADAVALSVAGLSRAEGADSLVLLAQELGALSVSLGVDRCGMGSCATHCVDGDCATDTASRNPYSRMCVNVLHRSALLATHNSINATPASPSSASSTSGRPISAPAPATPAPAASTFLPSLDSLSEVLPATAFPLSHCAPALHAMLEGGERDGDLAVLLERELHMEQVCRCIFHLFTCIFSLVF